MYYDINKAGLLKICNVELTFQGILKNKLLGINSQFEIWNGTEKFTIQENRVWMIRLLHGLDFHLFVGLAKLIEVI